MLISQVLQSHPLKKFKYFTRILKNLKFTRPVFVLRRNMNSKPPNILVYTRNDCPKLFQNIENNLLLCLQTHNYLVYHLLLSEVKKQPWMENTILLVVASDEMDDGIAAVFEKYILNSGKILLTCSKFNNMVNSKCVVQTSNKSKLIQINFKDIRETFAYRGKYSYQFTNSTVLCCDSYNEPVIHKALFDKGILIASEIYLDRDSDFFLEDCVSPKYDRGKCLMILKHVLTQEFGLKVKTEESFVPKLSPGYFISDRESADIEITRDPNICEDKPMFLECTVPFAGTEIKLPIYYIDKSIIKSLSFDKNLYFSSLNADIYGHCVIYFPVISSTMDIVEQLTDYDGIVIVASCQISGKGRGGNKWISPGGCAMFTLCFTLPLYSNLGQKLPLIQHIAALSVVHGIRCQDQYRKLNLKLKWPNDIYFDGSKIGGLIVASTIQGKLAHVSIGWGINVANEHPTSCLNSAIEKYNLENSCTLPYINIEELIAATVSLMEYFVKDFQKSGPDQFLHHYYSYWMHDLQEVTLVNLDKKGTIIGLDYFGFLVVKTENGEEISLQPDGNRFDIMRNLIYSK